MIVTWLAVQQFGNNIRTALWLGRGDQPGVVFPGCIFFQDLNTVPGRDYVLQLAAHISFVPIVTWGTNAVALTNSYTVGFVWCYSNCYVLADANTTRLTIGRANSGTGNFPLDDVKVGWLQEPVSILVQPASGSGLEGGPANFVVIAQGGPPLSYQWLFNDAPIFNETGSSLSLTGRRSV